MRLTPKLLGALHGVFDKDPHAFLALRLSYDGGMAWEIADGVLSTHVTGGSGGDLTVVLGTHSIQSLAQFLALQTGYAVPYYEPGELSQKSALMLSDASGNIGASNGDHIYGYQSFLISYLEANADQLEIAQAEIQKMLDQMSTTTAEAEWLDFLGTFYNVPRTTGEPDHQYANRIISSVLIPSSNNLGMAIAMQSNWQNTYAVVTDAGVSGGGLLIRDGSIKFNSAFVHNSSVGVVSDGFFDVTFAFDFAGPISVSAYVPLLLAVVNKYRAAGTYIRTLNLKNGISASIITSSYNVGSVLVVIYDQDRLPEDSFVWHDETVEHDSGDWTMGAQPPIGADAVQSLPLGGFEQNMVQEPDEDERRDWLPSEPVGDDGAPNPQPDGHDWTFEEPDEDSRMMVIETAGVGADAAPNPPADAWDWGAEEPDMDDRMSWVETTGVSSAAAPNAFDNDFNDLVQAEIPDFFADHFSNTDGEEPTFGDAWDWDEYPDQHDLS